MAAGMVADVTYAWSPNMRPTEFIEQGVDKMEFLFLRGYGNMLNGEKLREQLKLSRLGKLVLRLAEDGLIEAEDDNDEARP